LPTALPTATPSAVPAARDASSDGGDALALKQNCAWGDPGRDPYRGTVEQALEGAQLPPNLLPGLSVDVEIILDERDNVLRIPTYALLENSRVLEVESGRLGEKHNGTGLDNWSFTEITSGLYAGELVVVSLDRPDVKAGARVTVTGEVQR